MTWNASSIYMQAGWRKHKQCRDHEPGYWTVPQCEITPTLFLFGFLQLVKVYLLQVEGMGSLPVVLLLCSFHGTAAKQNTQIILFNYGWVPACLFLCRKTLPSCAFCSTALAAVAQEPQPGKLLTGPPSRPGHVRLPLPVSLVSCVSSLIVPFRFTASPAAPAAVLPQSESQMPALPASSFHTDWSSPPSPVCADCREEMYPCTRMYSVHRPTKQCVGAMCFYRWCGPQLSS